MQQIYSELYTRQGWDSTTIMPRLLHVSDLIVFISELYALLGFTNTSNLCALSPNVSYSFMDHISYKPCLNTCLEVKDDFPQRRSILSLVLVARRRGLD